MIDLQDYWTRQQIARLADCIKQLSCIIAPERHDDWLEARLKSIYQTAQEVENEMMK